MSSGSSLTNAPDGKRDFFISFNRLTAPGRPGSPGLEENGYSVFFQDWDFRGNFVEHMNRAHAQARRTLAVLSEKYFGSDFTLAEWSARFAQDPGAREDRLVPVKVGPLTGETILGPIIHADLTGCEEAEAKRRLLGRVKKAFDASYRDKPTARPGFPSGPLREVPSRPEFPPAGAEPVTSRGQKERASAGDRSISVGRDTVGNVMVTGDRNRVDAMTEASLNRITLPRAGSVNIGRKLAQIRAVLERVGGEYAGKIGRALDDAAEEARKPQPDKDEIGMALDRALDYAKKGSGSADEIAITVASMLAVVQAPPRAIADPAARDAQPVDAAVFCPPRVAKGCIFLVQVFLYPPGAEHKAAVQARDADAAAEHRGTYSLPLDLPLGTRVDVRLEMQDLVVAEPDAILVWRGSPTANQFEVVVPAGTTGPETIGRVRFAVDGIPVGTLRFKLELAVAGSVAAATALREAEAVRYRRAFVSYSSQDRAEVLRRVQAFRIAGLSVFQDVLDLDPGERWERALYHEIDICDVFLLFWSRAAAASEWVAKEISYALARKAGSDDRPLQSSRCRSRAASAGSARDAPPPSLQ